MKKNLMLLSLLVLLGSCSKKTYLTGNLMYLFEENELQLSKIQLYNDNPLFLEREVASSDANVKSGKVFFKNGRYINMISLEKETPGLLVKESKGQLLVGFESGSGEEKALHFAPVAGEKGEYFYQLVDEKGSALFSRLEYDGNRYLVIYKKPRVRLMVMKSTLNGLKIKTHKMKGNKVK